jgi:glycosyltransferase involved in cell wall biosynthesis
MNDSTRELLPRVAVLLPTYQGVRFLEIQLDSIISQEDVTTDIYVCDDGSTDGTLELIKKINSRYKFATIIESNRIGSTSAFFLLLSLVEGADFVAFCDQDDIWMPNKLIISIEKLAAEKSELVFSRREYIDEFGRVTGDSPRIDREPTWANAAVQNVAFGNTQVLSKNGFELVKQIGLVEVTHFDSWVYLLIASTYKVSNIDKNLIQYRLHPKNQIGLRKVTHFFDFHRRLEEYERQVDILLNVASEKLRQDAKIGLSKFRSRSFKFRDFLFSNESDVIFRQSKLETFFVRLLICVSTYSLKFNCRKKTIRT